MFDLHALNDPVYSMAPKAQAAPQQPAAQPQQAPNSSMWNFTQALAQLPGGLNEFQQMAKDTDYNAPSHYYTAGTAGSGGSSDGGPATPASSDYYVDRMPQQKFQQLQQQLGNPMYAGVNSATSPMNQQGGVGNVY